MENKACYKISIKNESKNDALFNKYKNRILTTVNEILKENIEGNLNIEIIVKGKHKNKSNRNFGENLLRGLVIREISIYCVYQ